MVWLLSRRASFGVPAQPGRSCADRTFGVKITKQIIQLQIVISSHFVREFAGSVFLQDRQGIVGNEKDGHFHGDFEFLGNLERLLGRMRKKLNGNKESCLPARDLIDRQMEPMVP